MEEIMENNLKWFSISIEDFYNSITDKYEIPSEYLTKGCKKNITQCISNYMKKENDIVVQTALTSSGRAKYIEAMWADNKSSKIALDSVIEAMLNRADCMVSGKTREFVNNIRGQLWISYKQFVVLSSILDKPASNAYWESDNDEELSKSYLGLNK